MPGKKTTPETDSKKRRSKDDASEVKSQKFGNGKNSARFPVVGIGASAGGLEAFKQFFSAMPSDSGIAFVLVQHLDPKHESMMVELLSKYTAMEVLQAQDEMRLEPNHIYMIPPNRYLEIQNGKLQLSEPVIYRGMRMPIDFFFRSLAREWKERAICIVLSGTGSDGALGLKAVKSQGGMIIAEDPNSAGYDGMPRSAINTGLVDFTLPVGEMPKTLVRYIGHPYIAARDTKSLVAGASSDHFQSILSMLRARTGYNFNSYKKGTLHRRIDRRLGLKQIDNLGDYVALLRSDESEIHQLFQDLLIGVTSFFRNGESWQLLEKEVLQKVIMEKDFDQPVRIWVSGCTTGEEAYSIAMILFEQFEKANKSFNAQIFATDINEESIIRARAGRYPQSIAAEVPSDRLSRFFHEEGDMYIVKRKVRESVVFAVQNLISDPPFSKLDLICCRNVLIYLESEVQNRIIQMFHFALAKDGHLFLGDSESVGKHADHFKTISKSSRIFRKAGKIHPNRRHFPSYPGERKNPTQKAEPNHIISSPQGTAEMARDLLLDRFAPASVLINRDYDTYYFHGPTRQYLDYPSGEPTRDLSALCLSGLKTKLRATVHQAAAGKGKVVSVAHKVKRNGNHVSVRISVEPVPYQRSREELFLVTFQDAGEAKAAADSESELPSEQVEIVSQIEYELQATREDLQSTIEELETSNEELKASNEEVMSMNEELQSTNEELETSREELQSLNEELSTVNSQLEDKIKEVEATNNDLSNLLSSTDIATIFLDTDFKVRRFTPATRDLIRLIDSDIGRPLSDIAQRFIDDDLLVDAESVLEKLAPVESEVINGDHRSYIRRIVPYRTEDNRIEGVVITFTDVSAIRKHTNQLHEREQQQASVAKLGQFALGDNDLNELCQLSCSEIQKVLRVPLTKILQYQPDHRKFCFMAGCGWKGHIKPGESYVTAHRGSQAGFTIESRYPVIVKDLAEEKRFSGPELLTSHDVVSGVSVIIGPVDEPWGVLGSHTTERRKFTVDDVNFLQAVANLLCQTIIRRNIADHHQRVIDSISDGFLMIDREFRYTFVNNVAIELLGKSREELLGKSMHDVFPDIRDTAFHQIIETVMKTGSSRELTEYYAPHDRWYDTKYYPAQDGGVSLIFTDVTADRAYRRQFKLALESGQMGIWSQNPATGLCTIDERICEFFDLPPETNEYKEAELLKKIHRDDRKRLDEFRANLRKNEDHEPVEFRVVSRQGASRWLTIRGSMATDHSGNPVRFSGILWDITELKSIEHQLRRANEALETSIDERTEELRILTENVPAYFAFVDSDMRYRFVNRQYHKLFRLKKEEIEGRLVSEIMSAENFEEIEPRIRGALKGNEQRFEIVLNIPRDGIHNTSVHYVPRREKNGTISGYFVLAINITEERRLQQEVLEAAELEKERIGRDLHDSICQELAGIGLFGQALSTSLAKREAKEKEDAEALVKQVNQVTQKARKLARGLSPVALENRTLPQALADLAEILDELTEGRCEFKGDTDIELESSISNQLYLIAREATMNAMRHGNPSLITITLSSDNGVLLLSVIDNGSGKIEKIEEGLGIRSMRYRAKILGGTLKVQKNPKAQGLKIVCRLRIDG